MPHSLNESDGVVLNEDKTGYFRLSTCEEFEFSHEWQCLLDIEKRLTEDRLGELLAWIKTSGEYAETRLDFDSAWGAAYGACVDKMDSDLHLWGNIDKALGRDASEMLHVLHRIANHGAMGGGHGLTAKADCVAFYYDNQASIREVFREYADDHGLGFLESIAGFGALQGIGATVDEVAMALYTREVDDEGILDTIREVMTWAIAEEYARRITDIAEDELEVDL